MNIKVRNIKVELFKESPASIDNTVVSGAGYARVEVSPEKSSGAVVDFSAVNSGGWGEVVAVIPLTFRDRVEALSDE